MTREEAIAILIREIDEDPFLRTEYREKIHEALKMGIKALEQTDALDKIAAEIERIGGDDEKAFCKNLNESYKQGLKDALKVIDKYRKEQE